MANQLTASRKRRRRKTTKIREARLLADEFTRRIQTLERTRTKAESLFSTGHIGTRDVGYIYEALFLSLITRFESVVEELFFGLLMGRLSSSVPRIRSKITIQSEAVTREILLSGHDYLVWLPYRRTEERARYYFASGLPFTMLDDGEKAFLRESLFVRNAVAHKSKFALKQFHQKVSSVSVLPPRERTPAGFLRSQFRVAPVQCRYENLAARLVLIANKLCR